MTNPLTEYYQPPVDSVKYEAARQRVEEMDDIDVENGHRAPKYSELHEHAKTCIEALACGLMNKKSAAWDALVMLQQLEFRLRNPAERN